MPDPRDLRGRERGRRVFVLGNGPSVLEEDLHRLRGEVVIGMNGSPFLETRFDFITQYYCVSDRRFLRNPDKRRFATEALNGRTLRIVRGDLRDDDDAAMRPRTFYVRPLGRDGFSLDLRRGFYFGCTTTMLALQLAHHLGCTSIYLLGVDLVYPADQPRFYPEASPQPADPFVSPQIYNLANARESLAERGCELFLCSPTSMLRPYVPFRRFSELFETGRDIAPVAA